MATVTVTVSALVTVLVTVLALPSASGHSCRDGFTVLSGVCVKVVVKNDDPLTWQQARSECQLLGADLAELPTAALLQHLASWTDKNGLVTYTLWVGAEETRLGWKWLTGPRISLNSELWLAGEPHYTGGDGKVLVVRRSDTYLLAGVAPDDRGKGYVCQA